MQNKKVIPGNALGVDDLELIKIFIKTGALSFGGWSTTAVLLDKELQDKAFEYAHVDLKGAIAYAQILPGATQVALVSNVGYQIKGFRGALVATISYLIPAISLIISFAILYFGYLRTADIFNYMDGLIAALSGIILANAYKIGSKHVSHPALWSLVIFASLALLWLQLHALAIILIFGTIGLVIAIFQRQKKV